VDILWIQQITGTHFSVHNFKVHTQAACRIKLWYFFLKVMQYPKVLKWYTVLQYTQISFHTEHKLTKTHSIHISVSTQNCNSHDCTVNGRSETMRKK